MRFTLSYGPGGLCGMCPFFCFFGPFFTVLHTGTLYGEIADFFEILFVSAKVLCIGTVYSEIAEVFEILHSRVLALRFFFLWQANAPMDINYWSHAGHFFSLEALHEWYSFLLLLLIFLITGRMRDTSSPPFFLPRMKLA
jgi:hypothetical protein